MQLEKKMQLWPLCNIKVIIAFFFLFKNLTIYLIIFSQLLHISLQCNTTPFTILIKLADIYMVKISWRKLKLCLHFPKTCKTCSCVLYSKTPSIIYNFFVLTDFLCIFQLNSVDFMKIWTYYDKVSFSILF